MSFRVITREEFLAARDGEVGYSRFTGYTGKMVDLTDEIRRGDARIEGYTHEESVAKGNSCRHASTETLRHYMKHERSAGLKRTLLTCLAVGVMALMTHLALFTFMSIM